ncbi:hypothetical protein [Actinacidiphila acidipaludis]|uniref:Uncharacterized protein n=1 Tax=Actinacidiphila acidipaludis TaxID=2873382 RepID=A0ABS7QF59_9ACTN|nr:hypothetical protein [Streptomyces acidipaludis]MBY8881799.1 hypothetical protein [Streptomyces acidipaludis]
MSANYPPPQQPAPGQNPYGPPPQAPYGAPPQGAWGAPPQQPGFNGAAYPPPAPMAPMAQRDNAGLGILAGLGAVVVSALLYGLLIKGTKHEIGWAALAVGALVGLALGKVGGRNPVLPFVGIPLALLGVYLGQLFGLALIAASANDVGVVDVFTQHFSFLQHAWKESLGAKDFLFFGIAGLEGFVFTKRVAR